MALCGCSLPRNLLAWHGMSTHMRKRTCDAARAAHDPGKNRKKGAGSRRTAERHGGGHPLHGRDPMRTRDLIGPRFKAISLIALSPCDGEMSIALPHRRVPQASSENDRNPRCDGVCPQKRRWSMHACANKHAHPTTASIDPCCRETHYCASHKNWISNIRFSIINRPLRQ